MVWSRRQFLKVTGLTVGATALGIGTSSCSDSTERSKATRENEREQLSSRELDEIVLLSQALFEPDDERESRELDTTMRWWAAGRTSSGPHLKLYRDGLATLASAVQSSGKKKAFIDLTTAERNAVLTALVRDNKEGPLKALTDELLEGIYSSAIGWKSLGYTTWPGVPSAPLEYTTRPHGPTRVVAAFPLAELIG